MKKSNIIRFGILGIFLLWVIITFPTLYPIRELTVYLATIMGKFIGINAVAYKEFMVVSFKDINRIFNISTMCTGIVLYIIFLMATLLIPNYKLKDRLIGLLFIPILLLGNVIRILMSVYIAIDYSIDFSLFFHDTIGQVFIFAIGIFSYLLWLKITGNFIREKKTENIA